MGYTESMSSSRMGKYCHYGICELRLIGHSDILTATAHLDSTNTLCWKLWL